MNIANFECLLDDQSNHCDQKLAMMIDKNDLFSPSQRYTQEKQY